MLFFHGSLWDKGLVSQFAPHAYAFAQRGVVSLLFEYRLQSTDATGAVEVMGGLKVRKGAVWRAVRVHEPMRTRFGAHRWLTPTLEDQVRILKLFGREKDLEKVRRIRHLG